MRISAIVVNYNSGLHVLDCVEGLLQHLDSENTADEIIVVDNNSTDNSVDSIKSYPTVRIVQSSVNVGYAGGCNIGSEHTSGDILLFMNPDAVLTSPVTCIRDRFEQNDDCAIVAPGIIEQGDLYGLLRPFPSVLSDTLGELGLGYLLFREYCRGVTLSTKQKYDFFSGYAQGSAFFVRRDAFERIGRFDAGFFLYYEEVDFFKRMADHGFRFIYEPGCLVRHASGGSSDELDWKKTAIRYNSKFRYFSKHFTKVKLGVHRIATLAVLLLKISLYLPGVTMHLINQRKINAYIYALRLYIKGYMGWLAKEPWL